MLAQIAVGSSGRPVLLVFGQLPADQPINLVLNDSDGFTLRVGADTIGDYEGFAPEAMSALRSAEEVPVVEIADPKLPFERATNIAYVS